MSFTEYWWIGLVVATATLAIVGWVNIVTPLSRRIKMRRPYDVSLTLAPEKGRQGWLQEIHLPPDTETCVQLRMTSRLKFTQHELLFGILGEGAPEIVKYRDDFVRGGLRAERSPETADSHYFDSKGAYHIQEDRPRVLGGLSTYGFVIKTKAPGIFPVRVGVITDSGDWETKALRIVVETRE